MFNFADHYKTRLAAIGSHVARLPQKAPPQLILLGDSVSEQNPIHQLASYQVMNMGISGDEIEHAYGGVIKRLNLLPLVRPVHIMLLIGVNDLNNAAKNVNTIEPQYEQLVERIRTIVPSCELHLMELLPTRDGYARLMPSIAMMNVIIEEIAARHGLKFVDTFAPMEDEEGMLRQNFTEDGLHLNDEGYEVLNNVLEEHLKSGESY